MAFDSAQIELTDAPVSITHPDRDLKSGYSAVIRCDGGNMYVGGPDVTPTTGYLVLAGTEFGYDGPDGELFVVLDQPGPLTCYALWGGV